MPPKKKVVSKTKEALTANYVEETQPIVQQVSEVEKRNLDVTVVIEKMPESGVSVSLPIVESVEMEPENVKKVVQKKTVKSKSKLKTKQLEEEESKPKKGRKRAVSEDRTIIYPEQKAIKSRKKAPSKDVNDTSSDVISPIKRGRRAASVDILSSDIMVSTHKEIKKTRKAEKSSNDQEEENFKYEIQEDDQLKPAEKAITKGKKNIKKVVEKLDEKEIFESDQGILNDVPKTSQEKPKSKRGASKNEQTSESIEEIESTEKTKKATKTIKSTRSAPKSKLTEENEVEKKTKRAPRGKQVVKSYSEESEDNEQNPEKVEDLVIDTLEISPEKISKSKTKPVKAKEVEKKTKRIPKAKQIAKSSEESEDNNDIDTNKNNEIVKKLSNSPIENNESKPVALVEEKEVEKKQKRAPRGKQIPKLYEEPDDINLEKIESDSIDIQVESPEKIETKPKAKRGVRKEKQQNLAESKLIEELHQKFAEKNSSPTGDEENTGDLPNGQPSTPESGKDEVQPVVKRKPKGKTAKK
ncbi:ABC transporter F family member 4-like isoform X2 [Daktulosphaira vitifoliae]|uniref:ABC transporter F family member 4-like isoform X2 n=1 Tax=Daktulosphaira vitifoliae TaxID=58002 RepID=UPI0021AA5AA2|nr:ABC transporter F family member 4-like isoform X2 [Daktulosphaira vitifoliae]XP_050543243.1 ABC transporter F family member 4-like isoform X2 [Daktulosphaira vitifoliae]XP_050543244.1 ABC transporter F family member 4-like isoform X2 [Daktulosphaira vitifoliae]